MAKKELTGNRGEWSEIYTHFRLLADGILSDGDAKYSKTGNSLPIVKITRKEKGTKGHIDYIVDNENNTVHLNGEHLQLQVCKERFSEEAKNLLRHIKKQKASNDKKKFSFPDVQQFMQDVGMHNLKASSNRKEDIRIVLHDIMTEKDRSLGFSIKSKLGGSSTLFNSNKDGTNFKFRIEGNITGEEIEYLNSLSDTKAKRQRGFTKNWFKYFNDYGFNINFLAVINETFKSNLSYIDSHFDKFLANCLLIYYSHGYGNKVADIVKHVATINPCNQEYNWYEYKMKQFLLNTALGMTPNKKWNCKYAANGGYIVVKENGDILCYHFYDREQLENYLFYNTAFDTPSTSRHLMYQINGEEMTLNLNLQIRFIHKV